MPISQCETRGLSLLVAPDQDGFGIFGASSCHCNKPLGRSGHYELWQCGGTSFYVDMTARDEVLTL